MIINIIIINIIIINIIIITYIYSTTSDCIRGRPLFTMPCPQLSLVIIAKLLYPHSKLSRFPNITDGVCEEADI